jgi:drug/metabolite transporter (DMT)-like permease
MLMAFGMSLLGATGYYVLLAQAIVYAGTEVPTLIIGTIPIWVMLLGKPLGLRWSALLPGLLLTGTGLALMMQASLQAPVAQPAHALHFWWGVCLAVVAMACWTAFAVLNAAWLKRHPEVTATEWANWLGIATGLGAYVLWLLAGTDLKVLLTQDSIGQSAIVCIATGIGSAWAASILWNLASRRLSVSLCGQLIVSETLFALLYSYAWDKVWPDMAQTLAAVLFTLGILASIRAHQS